MTNNMRRVVMFPNLREADGIELAEMHLHARTVVNGIVDKRLLAFIGTLGRFPLRSSHLELMARIPAISPELATIVLAILDRSESDGATESRNSQK